MFRGKTTMMPGAMGRHVTRAANGSVAAVFVTHGPVAFDLSPEDYAARKIEPEIRELPEASENVPAK